MSLKFNKSIKVILSISLLLIMASSLAEEEPKSNFFTTSDGVKIHYLTLGDQGSYVILLHAYTSSAHENWFDQARIAQILAKNHRVVALDLRDHGLSAKTVDQLAPGSQLLSGNILALERFNIWFGSLLEVEELFEHLEIKKAHLHGYSLGGGLVSQLLQSHQNIFITASMGGFGMGANVEVSAIHIPVLFINGELDNPIEKTTHLKLEIANFKSVVLNGRSHLDAVGDPNYLVELSEFIDENDP